MEMLPPLAVVVPLLMAAFLVVLERQTSRHRLLDIVTLATALFVLVLDLLLLKASFHGTLVTWFGEWRPINGFPVGIAFVTDPAAAGLAAMTAFLSIMGLLFSWHHFKAVGIFYHSLMLLFLAAMTGFCLTGDLFNLFVFFEMMGVAGYALTGYQIEDTGPLEGALNFAVMNSLGGLLVLFGIAIIYSRTGTLNLAGIGAALAAAGSDGTVATGFLLLTAGFLVKGAVLPFHFWLPDAHAVAPTPVSVLFSGIMVELGLYAVARIYWGGFHGVLAGEPLRLILAGIGAATAVAGACMAFLQRHLKRMLAFSTVSHAGIILTGIALLDAGGLGGGLHYIVGHGCIKGALFICSGIVLHRVRSVDEVHLRGRCRHLGIAGLLFLVCGLALAGLPPFALGAGKAAVESAARTLGLGWVVPVLAFASAATGGSVLRAWAGIFRGWGTPDIFSLPAPSAGTRELAETDHTEKRTPPAMWLPALLLVLAALAAGHPTAALLCRQAADRLVDTAGYRAAVLTGVPPGIAATVAPEPEFLPGLVTTLLAVGIAASGLFMSRLPERFLRRARSLLDAPVGLLRAIHSGYIGDYALWLLAGTAGLLLAAVLLTP